ncbi:MAG: polymer-forming cytoskeletal protein [Verrucomicrobiota bacterium]
MVERLTEEPATLKAPDARSAAPASGREASSGEAALSAEDLTQKSSSSVNLLGPDVTVQGDVRFQGRFFVDGQVNGDIRSKGELIVQPKGLITGDLYVDSAFIEGKVRGNVAAKTQVVLSDTAQVLGDIITPHMSAEPGSVFSGSATIGPASKGELNKRFQQ